MKKAFLKLLSLTLAASMLLTGCGGASTGSDESAPDAVSEITFDPNVNPKGVLPIVKEPITLDIAIQNQSLVTDFKDNELTKWIEEQTGITLNFTVLPEKDTATKVNLMFAAGKDLPDVLILGSLPNTTLNEYIADELVIPLDAYIEEYGENYVRMMEENPAIKKACVAMDGHVYGMPKYNVTEHNMLKHGKMYLYQPWLDKLNLEVPKTVDDLYNVLKAFKEQDPNGNGKADEVPFAGATSGAGTDVIQALMAPFIPYNTVTSGLLEKDGKIIASYTQPEFKQGMEFIHKLVSEKLVDPVSFTQDQAQLKQLANRDEMILGGFAHAYTAVNANSPRVFEYTCLPLLSGGTDQGGFLRDPLYPAGPSFIVTADCEHPEAAYRLGDFLLSKEACMRNRFGVKDRDWKFVDDDATDIEGINGDPAQFRIINNVWGETGNTLWRSECLLYYDYNQVYGAGRPKDVLNPDKYHHQNSKNCFKPYVVGDIVPYKCLFYTSEEMNNYSLLATSIEDHLKVNLAAFATGNRDMSEWDTFQKELENLGLEDYLNYINTAYSRQFLGK